MIDRKITPKEIAENGLIVDDVEIIPPVSEDTQSQKRNKRELCYYKLFGRVYYQVSDLLEFAEKNKTYAVVPQLESSLNSIRNERDSINTKP